MGPIERLSNLSATVCCCYSIAIIVAEMKRVILVVAMCVSGIVDACGVEPTASTTATDAAGSRPVSPLLVRTADAPAPEAATEPVKAAVDRASEVVSDAAPKVKDASTGDAPEESTVEDAAEVVEDADGLREV